VPLVAESPRSWVYFSYRASALVRFSFGDAGSLALETATGTTRGTRSER
jgi:hypothetical protein